MQVCLLSIASSTTAAATASSKKLGHENLRITHDAEVTRAVDDDLVNANLAGSSIVAILAVVAELACTLEEEGAGGLGRSRGEHVMGSLRAVAAKLAGALKEEGTGGLGRSHAGGELMWFTCEEKKALKQALVMSCFLGAKIKEESSFG